MRICVLLLLSSLHTTQSTYLQVSNDDRYFLWASLCVCVTKSFSSTIHPAFCVFPSTKTSVLKRRAFYVAPGMMRVRNIRCTHLKWNDTFVGFLLPNAFCAYMCGGSSFFGPEKTCASSQPFSIPWGIISWCPLYYFTFSFWNLWICPNIFKSFIFIFSIIIKLIQFLPYYNNFLKIDSSISLKVFNLISSPTFDISHETSETCTHIKDKLCHNLPLDVSNTHKHTWIDIMLCT